MTSQTCLCTLGLVVDTTKCLEHRTHMNTGLSECVGEVERLAFSPRRWHTTLFYLLTSRSGPCITVRASREQRIAVCRAHYVGCKYTTRHLCVLQQECATGKGHLSTAPLVVTQAE